MVTGATTADAVVVLVDARNGVLEQTRRHLAVVQLLRVPHVIIAVNKIDLLGYDEAAFTRVARMSPRSRASSACPRRTSIPVSALAGDNVVDRSANTPWYDGPSLLELLETAPVARRARDRARGPAHARAARHPPAGLGGDRRRRPRALPRLPCGRGPHRIGHRARRRRGAGVPGRCHDDGDRHRLRCARARRGIRPAIGLAPARRRARRRTRRRRRGRGRAARSRGASSTRRSSSSTPARCAPAPACS